MKTARRLVLGAFLAVLTAAPALAAVAPREPDDMAMGAARARVTVVEYASVGCPHCAKWANEVFPAFKAKYVDTGRVRFVMREMLTGEPRLAAAGFMVARCAAPAKYFAVVDDIFRRQADMFAAGGEVGKALDDIAKTSGGLTEDAFQACISDQAGLDALNARAERHATVDKVDSTPTFFIGGQRFDGELTLDQVAAAIRAARRRH
jgi:protein-disulfide isomerase